MTLKVITSVSVLVLALAFSGQASAKTIRGVEISESDLPKVQKHCDELDAGSAASLSSSDSSRGEGSGEMMGGDAATETGTLSGGATAIDLASITAEECNGAGM